MVGGAAHLGRTMAVLMVVGRLCNSKRPNFQAPSLAPKIRLWRGQSLVAADGTTSTAGQIPMSFFATDSMRLIGLLPKENVMELNDPELGAQGSAIKVSERDLLPEASETVRCFLLIAEVSERASLFMP